MYNKTMPETTSFTCFGYEVVADWYERSTNVIDVFCIGWTASRSHYREMLSWLADTTGHSIVCIDYSGHGDSPLELDDTYQAQHLLELVSGVDQLKQQHPAVQFNFIGSSYGSYLAAQLSQQRLAEHLIMIAPAIYQPSDLYHRWGDINVDWTRQVYRHDSTALKANPLLHPATIPSTLVMVHGLDDLVPATTSDAYIEAFKAEHFVATELEHSLNDDLFKNGANQDYLNTISEFLQRTPVARTPA